MVVGSGATGFKSARLAFEAELSPAEIAKPLIVDGDNITHIKGMGRSARSRAVIALTEVLQKEVSSSSRSCCVIFLNHWGNGVLQLKSATEKELGKLKEGELVAEARTRSVINCLAILENTRCFLPNSTQSGYDSALSALEKQIKGVTSVLKLQAMAAVRRRKEVGGGDGGSSDNEEPVIKKKRIDQKQAASVLAGFGL